jgi:hypothetical protein
VLVRASMLLVTAFGERRLVERELRSDHRVVQRVNPGVPIDESQWTEVGHFDDLDSERERLRAEGWAVDSD